MSTRIRFAAAAFMLTAIASSATFTALGWSFASVDGTTYSPGQTLPSAVGFFTSGTQSTSLCGVGRYKFVGDSRTLSAEVTALFTAKYRLNATSAPPAGTTAAVTGTTRSTESAYANVSAAGYSSG